MRVIVCLLLGSFASAVRADALATELYVLDRAAAQKLAETAGGLDRVTEAQLRHAGLHRAVFTGSITTSLQNAPRLRLLAARKGNELIYSVVFAPPRGPERLECVGRFPVKEQKAFGTVTDWRHEPFVVIARVGNFLKR